MMSARERVKWVREKAEEEKWDREKTLKLLFAEIGNGAYHDNGYFESLEWSFVQGNGHHIRQKMAAFAQQLFVNRLNEADRKLLGKEKNLEVESILNSVCY